MDLKLKYSMYFIGGLCLIAGITIIAIKINGRNSNEKNKSSNNSVGSSSDNTNGNASKNVSGNSSKNVSGNESNSTNNSSNNNNSNSSSNNTNTESADNNPKVSNDQTAKTSTVNPKNQNNQDMNKNQPESVNENQPTDTKETPATSEVPLSEEVNTPQENNKSQEPEMAQDYNNLNEEQRIEFIKNIKKDIINLGRTDSERKKIFSELEKKAQDFKGKDSLKKLFEFKQKILKEQQGSVPQNNSDESSWIANTTANLMNGVKNTSSSAMFYVYYFIELFKSFWQKLSGSGQVNTGEVR